MRNKDMYETFNNFDFNYGYECGCNRPDPSISTYDMDFEDTTILPFYIDTPWQDHLIILNIFNFRHEIVFQTGYQYPDEDGRVYLHIDQQVSHEIFKPGIYYCQVQAIKIVNDGSFEQISTLLSASDCMIHVR